MGLFNSSYQIKTFLNRAQLVLLLADVQSFIVNKHSHNTHTMHVVSNGFRSLYTVVNPSGTLRTLGANRVEMSFDLHSNDAFFVLFLFFKFFDTVP